MLNRAYACLLFLLALPACAGNGGAAQQSSATPSGGRRTFVGQQFKDTTTLAAFVQPKDVLLVFERCTFAGPMRFTEGGTEFTPFAIGAVFKDCTFEADVLADQTTFMGRINMVNCRFKGRAQFNNCTFSAPAGWRTCAFDGDAAFTNSLFRREASFMDCNFSDVARLQACRFMSSAQFGNAVFRKNADFTLCRFAEGAFLDYTHFVAAADFGSAHTNGPLTLRTAHVGKLLLTNLQASGPVYLTDLQTTDSVRIQGASFAKGKPQLPPK